MKFRLALLIQLNSLWGCDNSMFKIKMNYNKCKANNKYLKIAL